jgi:serine/threonine-protein kinase
VTQLKPGTKVSDNVRLVRPLGSGAMGSVWIGEHLTLETQVAVKFIHRILGEDPELAARFSFEAKAAAKIKSPHVVQTLDHGFMQDGTPYIVMELLEGESLAARLERAGWLSLKQCADVVTQVAKALSRAHAEGIVHRDIKPENIFLCPSEDGPFVKLLDFGIAKQNALPQRGLTSPGVMVGTAEYMSREQVLSSRDVDFRCDLWGLAVVAYEMLTGDLPFRGDSLGQICVAICNGDLALPAKLRKDLGEPVDAWFKRAFAKAPEERFGSARELALSFRRALFGEEPGLEDSFSGVTPAPQPVPGTDVGMGPAPREISEIETGATEPPPSGARDAGARAPDDEARTDASTDGEPAQPRDDRAATLSATLRPVLYPRGRGRHALAALGVVVAVTAGAFFLQRGSRSGAVEPPASAATPPPVPATPPVPTTPPSAPEPVPGSAPAPSAPAPEPAQPTPAPAPSATTRRPVPSATASAVAPTLPSPEPAHDDFDKRKDYGF